jgi:predicted Zn-dependent protease
LVAALERDPANLLALWGLFGLEGTTGNYQKQLEFAQKAAAVEPLVSADIVPGALFAAGRVNEAESAAEAGLALDSMSVANCWWCVLAQVAASRGDVDRYRSARSRLLALGRWNDDLELIALARAGRIQEARAMLAELRANFKSGKASAVTVAESFAALNEADSAFAWLNRVVFRVSRSRRLVQQLFPLAASKRSTLCCAAEDRGPQIIRLRLLPGPGRS